MIYTRSKEEADNIINNLPDVIDNNKELSKEEADNIINNLPDVIDNNEELSKEDWEDFEKRINEISIKYIK